MQSDRGLADIERWIPTARLAERAALRRVFANAHAYRIEADDELIPDAEAVTTACGLATARVLEIGLKNLLRDSGPAERGGACPGDYTKRDSGLAETEET